LSRKSLGTGELVFAGSRDRSFEMAEDNETVWHKELIAKNRAILKKLEDGNIEGAEVFPETQSEIYHLKAQIVQSELIVAAGEKDEADKA
jgi:hypothetical protein